MGKLGVLGCALLFAACAGTAQHELPHATFSVPGPGAPIGHEGWTSPWLEAPFAFDQLLPSWNVQRIDDAGFRVEVQVRTGADQPPTPWLDLGGWGEWPAAERAPSASAGAEVEVDILKAHGPQRALRLRFRTKGRVEVKTLHLCFTRSHQLGAPVHRAGSRFLPAIAVPQRRQTEEAAALAPRICSPTAVSMLLAHNGLGHPTETVAALLHDPQHDLYGNWNRAVQGAFELGLHGHLTRFNSWHEAAAELARGTPLIISIGAEEGQLSGTPYLSTTGHLLVIVGLDGRGGALVLDPAVPAGEVGPRIYLQTELAEVWLRRGGFSYVLGSPEQVPILSVQD